MVSALSQLTPDAREWVESSGLDVMVGQYVRYMRTLTEHSANEVLAAAYREAGVAQFGDEFDRKVEAY